MKSENIKTRNTRIYYLDLMRALAAIGVVTIHVSAIVWYDQKPLGEEWLILLIYNAFARLSVPMFLMISGVIWLNPNKKVDMDSLYHKNIKKFIVAFCFWTVIYAVVEMKVNHIPFAVGSIPRFLKECLKGHDQMWYLYLITGMYIALPLLKKIAEDKKLLHYFMKVSFITSIVICTILDIPGLLWVRQIRDYMGLNIAYGMIFYFVLGYVLNEKVFTKGKRVLIYCLGIFGFAAMVLISCYFTYLRKQSMTYLEGMQIFCAMQSVGGFVFLKQIGMRKQKGLKLISILAKYSFFIYLFHNLLLEFVVRHNITPVTLTGMLGLPSPFKVVGAPLMIVAIVAVSLGMAVICSKISFVRKYLV